MEPGVKSAVFRTRLPAHSTAPTSPDVQVNAKKELGRGVCMGAQAVSRGPEPGSRAPETQGEAASGGDALFSLT